MAICLQPLKGPSVTFESLGGLTAFIYLQPLKGPSVTITTVTAVWSVVPFNPSRVRL